MRYIHLTPQRLYCPTCEDTYSLPSNGTIKLYKELKCPLDKFELVYFSLGNSATAQGKGYPLCPYCYNHPPEFSETHSAEMNMKSLEISPGETDSNKAVTASISKSAQAEKAFSGMGCNMCSNPSCVHSYVYNGICPCPGDLEGRTCTGTLVFDENSKPNWKLGCNKCHILLRFHGNVHDLKPHAPGDNCQDCGVRLITVEFNKMKPLPNGELSRSGCIVCDDTLTGLTELIAGRSMNITVLRQMRAKRAAMSGRGGRGRGGRGRGRGPKGDAKMSFSDF